MNKKEFNSFIEENERITKICDRKIRRSLARMDQAIKNIREAL